MRIYIYIYIYIYIVAISPNIYFQCCQYQTIWCSCIVELHTLLAPINTQSLPCFYLVFQFAALFKYQRCLIIKTFCYHNENSSKILRQSEGGSCTKISLEQWLNKLWTYFYVAELVYSGVVVACQH